MKKISWNLLVVLCMVQGLWAATDANLPDNFPAINAQIHNANAVAEGKIFLAVAAESEDVGYYLMVLNNDDTSDVVFTIE